MLLATLALRPPDAADAGIDLDTLAHDTLASLHAGNESTLELWVTEALRGNTTDAETHFDRVLPDGSRYALRLQAGDHQLHLLPDASTVTATTGSVGTAYIHPDWSANGPAYDDVAVPGEALGALLWQCIEAPTGSSIGPDGDDWIDSWIDGSDIEVPTGVPFGVWDAYLDPACTVAATNGRVHVALDDALLTDRPVYAVHLVVWTHG
ncbi:MAG: hypothetical protein ACPGQL_08560 [Thermoplasmatota archaeon]